jgi:NodT family efflux transporter outer membrane factor (OMF) lipoprotein
LRYLVIAALVLSASGCGLTQWVQNGFKVGPEYCSPPLAPVAERWLDASDARLGPDLPEYPDWWSVFKDPVLDGLIRTAYEQNLSLREAGWRVMQARARRSITAGNLFPQAQQAFGDFARIQESQTVALPAPLRAFDDWSTGFNVSWELDVWGRLRRAIASADADVAVSVADYDAVLISLIAEVATAYNDYRTFQQRLEFARHNVKIQEGSLQLTEEKADAGATGYTSVHLANSSLEATRSAIPSLRIGLQQSSNRLCTLLGIPTQDLTRLLGTGDIPSAPAEVAVGIPADLLRRRPDIRAAERTVAAQSEQIGIAVADLYPHFVINGQITLESEHFSDLFSSASLAGIVGPSFRWNLLNYGRIINNVRLQGFGLDELVARYRNTVLTANQEVEDALVAFLQNLQRVEHLTKTAKETENALKLLTISFEEGDISFTGVFVLQGELASRQDQLAQARGDVVTSLITLYKALGGGWQIRCPGFEFSPPAGGIPIDHSPPEEIPTPVPPTPEALPELSDEQ